jgi:cbb3-type cytochrome oxidase maturation protein
MSGTEGRIEMRAKAIMVKALALVSGLLLLMTPSPAFAHDNVGGDELAVANWMLISALVVAGLGALALIWAVRAGQFSNVEESKFTMLETADDYDSIMAAAEARERSAVQSDATGAAGESRLAESKPARSGQADGAAHA